MRKRLILASASPRRCRILKQLRLKFDVIPSDMPEELAETLPPEQLAVRLAENKAFQVAQNAACALVIAADTIVVVNGRIFGKPEDEKEAEKMLTELSGRTHTVITGIAVVDSDSREAVSDYEKTLVTMRSFDISEIRKYIQTGEPMDKAGAYAIQGFGSLLVSGIEGCYFNVVGLPVVKLDNMLRHFGINIM